MEIRSIVASMFIFGALMGVIVLGGPILLAALAIIAYLAIRQWSETIEQLDRSAINIVTVVGVLHLTELYLTAGLGPSALTVPFIALAILLAWYYFTRRDKALAIVSHLILLFLLIPYSLGFILLLRDMPDLIGVWATVSVASVSVILSGGVWLTRTTHRWVQAVGLISISSLAAFVLLQQPSFLFDLKTHVVSSVAPSILGYFGCLIYKTVRKEPSIDWLATIFAAIFAGPTLYILLTFLS